MRSAKSRPLAPNEVIESLMSSAAHQLARHFGGPVRLEALETFGDYPHVIRCAVRSPVVEAPTTVIVKQAKPRDQLPYDPLAQGLHDRAPGLFHEWASLQLLSQSALEPPLAPRFYAGDRLMGYIIMEDIGPAASLDQMLLDPTAPHTHDRL